MKMVALAQSVSCCILNLLVASGLAVICVLGFVC